MYDHNNPIPFQDPKKKGGFIDKNNKSYSPDSPRGLLPTGVGIESAAAMMIDALNKPTHPPLSLASLNPYHGKLQWQTPHQRRSRRRRRRW
jgi:hypothetical protein